MQLAVTPAPGPEIFLTFDDGNASDREIALPILSAHQVRAEFFVCAGRLGRPGYLDAEGLEELISAGMEVGSHGMDHVNWRRAGPARRAREFEEARRVLREVTGRPVLAAAIPFGAYNGPVLAGLRRAGFRTVYSSDGGVARDGASIYPRNTVTAGDIPEDVLTALRSPETVPRRVLGRLRRVYKRHRIW